MAPTASERRSPIVRGSSSQTPCTICATRRLSTAASVANSRPHTEVVSAGSSRSPIEKSLVRVDDSERRTAAGSYRKIHASIA